MLLLLVCASAGPAQAHGGGTPQLVQAPSGPYQVYAWTNPDPARIGVLHVTVSLVQPATQEPVLDADVQIVAAAGEGGQTVSAPATHENAVIKTYYEADLDLPAAGPWQITVAHSDAAGSGSASFSLDVQPAAFNWRPIAVGAVLAVIAAGAWFLLRKNAPSAV
ncbi:MAG: FixH family protein [Burkholderiaceae bacterium]|nr:FixH family protein [Burkholderiaceae bacterium]